MPFTSRYLDQLLSTLAAGESATRLVVAFSGGLDSTVLLHSLASAEAGAAVPLLAVHIQHNLHKDAEEWEAHCRAVADKLQVDYRSTTIEVDRASGLGIEASARASRYQALWQMMQAGDWLLSAHHQDDQAETLLLNLLRGSGMAGLAGIGARQAFGPGQLVRPLLDVSQRELQAYAETHDLTWLDDPSNTNTEFDRNYLRHNILPLLTERWPAAAARLARSAELAAEASALLGHLADEDLRSLGEPQRLEISALANLSDERQRNVLRRALKHCGLRTAPATALRQILDELIPAKADAEPLVRWSGTEARRYRDFLYLLAELPDKPPPTDKKLSATEPSIVLPGLGELSLHNDGNQDVYAIQASIVENGLQIRFRTGGEEIRPAGHDCTHKLKKLLQQKGIVPWMRDRIPLLYVNDHLVAVANLWIAADATDNNGPQINWKDHPTLY